MVCVCLSGMSVSPVQAGIYLVHPGAQNRVRRTGGAYTKTPTPSNSHTSSRSCDHTQLHQSHTHTSSHVHTNTHRLCKHLWFPLPGPPLPSAKATLRLCKCHGLCCSGPGRPGKARAGGQQWAEPWSAQLPTSLTTLRSLCFRTGQI